MVSDLRDSGEFPEIRQNPSVASTNSSLQVVTSHNNNNNNNNNKTNFEKQFSFKEFVEICRNMISISRCEKKSRLIKKKCFTIGSKLSKSDSKNEPNKVLVNGKSSNFQLIEFLTDQIFN